MSPLSLLSLSLSDRGADCCIESSFPYLTCTCTCTCSNPPSNTPTLLHINSDSLDLFLVIYHIAFRQLSQDLLPKHNTTPRVSVSPHLYIYTYSLQSTFPHYQFTPIAPSTRTLRSRHLLSPPTAKMAQSRPLATSPPPLSPRTHSEKKHHSRRKSGKDYVVSEKKSTRPAMSRRTTPQHITKVAPIWNGRSSHRDRDDDAYGGRDSGESFPQFW